MATASSAPKGAPDSIIQVACCMPTRRGRSQLLAASALVPRATKGSRNLGVVVDDHQIAVQEERGPEPHRQPVDRGHERLGESGQGGQQRIERPTELGAAPGPAHLGRSTPAEKARPLPVRTQTATPGSAAAASSGLGQQPGNPSA